MQWRLIHRGKKKPLLNLRILVSLLSIGSNMVFEESKSDPHVPGISNLLCYLLSACTAHKAGSMDRHSSRSDSSLVICPPWPYLDRLLFFRTPGLWGATPLPRSTWGHLRATYGMISAFILRSDQSSSMSSLQCLIFSPEMFYRDSLRLIWCLDKNFLKIFLKHFLWNMPNLPKRLFVIFQDPALWRRTARVLGL